MDTNSHPEMLKIKNGWLARGAGWAVRGQTQEEAVEAYRQAEARHAEIDRRPVAAPPPENE